MLPEAATLETAKSYREKKAKPILEKSVKVLRAMYHSYLDVKYKLGNLQHSYDIIVERNAQLSAKINELVAESKDLKSEITDLEMVKRVFGVDRIKPAIELVKAQEKEKAHKNMGKKEQTEI